MNKLKNILIGLLCIQMFSCTDFVDPAIPYTDFETGVYLRTISSTPNFDFFQLAEASWNITIEAVDEEDGNLVQEVDVFVSRRRVQMISPEVKILTVPRSAFASNSESKYLRASFSVTIPDALAAMGFTTDDINGGDFFEFRLELRDTRGRTFTNTNLSGDVSGGVFYRSPFFYRIPVICPSNLAGEYDLMTTTEGFCGNVFEGEVRFVDGDTEGTYIIQVNIDGNWVDDFSFGAYNVCYGPGTAEPGGGNGLRMTDACGQIAFNTAGSSPWGDNFIMTSVEVNGSTLTLGWESSWPPEQGVSNITRRDGSNWPPLKL
jgi:hypothetical protein